MKHEEYMKKALLEANKARQEDEVPVGCVVVRDGEIVAKAHNKREKTNLAISHAEINALLKASKKLGTWCLKDCDFYVTLEPCMMCMGALFQAQVKHVYYGATDQKGGAVESVLDYKQLPHMHRHPQTTGGILKEECAQILKDFFKEKRKK